MKTGIAIWRFAVLKSENRFVFLDPEYLKSEIKKVLQERNESTRKTNQPPRPDGSVRAGAV